MLIAAPDELKAGIDHEVRCMVAGAAPPASMIAGMEQIGFKLTHVPGIEWINEQAQMWMRYYNSVRVHSRHGLTRWAKWMEITQQQLRLVDADLARALLTHAPETPKVDREQRVRFAGRVWNLRDVPGVMVGEKVSITYNPFDQATAYVVQL